MLVILLHVLLKSEPKHISLDTPEMPFTTNNSPGPRFLTLHSPILQRCQKRVTVKPQ